MKNIFHLFIVLAVCSGCTTILLDVKPIQSDQKNPAIVYEKNYTIGTPMTAYIGQSMIKWREGILKESQKYIVFDDDFTFKFQYGPSPMPARSCTIRGAKGFESSLQSMTEYHDNKYYLVERESAECPTFDLLIAEDGSLNKSLIAFGSKGYALTRTELSPPTAHFTIYSKPDMLTGITRELIFSGMNNVSIDITYREYTSDNITRQAFTENLVYETKAETIRFRDFKLKVLEISSEKIVFTVLDDGGLPACDITAGLKCQTNF